MTDIPQDSVIVYSLNPALIDTITPEQAVKFVVYTQVAVTPEVYATLPADIQAICIRLVVPPPSASSVTPPVVGP